MAGQKDQELLRELYDYHPDGYLINKIHRKRSGIGQRACSVNVKYYRALGFRGRMVREHVLIWVWHYGEWPDVIDLIDHNKLNNKIENLRNVTHKINSRHGNGIQRGISIIEKSGKYRSRITVDDRTIHLGCFDNYEDALSARLKAEKELWQ